jgi:hypothetical protein
MTFLISKNIIADTFLSEEEKDKALILNQDFSFTIPSIKYVDVNGVTHYYKVDFIFAPRGNKLLFEVNNVDEDVSSEPEQGISSESEQGTISSEGKQVINLVIEKIELAKKAINDGKDTSIILDLIEEAKDTKKEIRESDLVSRFASKAAGYLKKAARAIIQNGDMVEAIEHLNTSKQLFEDLKLR